MDNEGPSESVQAASRGQILDLLRPKPSDFKDGYKEETTPRPLTFDRVNEGRPPSSHSILFKLPVEVLANILLYIPQESFPSFALVNSDCRQLARSRQFWSISLDYSDSCLQLGMLLENELQERLANNGQTTRPSLGACIRQLKIAALPSCIESRHSLSTKDVRMLPREQWSSRLDKASSLFFDRYIPAVQSILPTLPHLQLLDWRDGIEVNYGFFETLLKSNFRHLRLFDIKPSQECRMDLSNKLSTQSWPLRALYLDLSRPSQIDEKVISGYPPPSISILRACAKTLESLTWVVEGLYGIEPIPVNWDLAMPDFPKLRDLIFVERGFRAFPEATMLDKLIPNDQCSLRSLSISADDGVVSEFLDKRGRIQSLERLELYDSGTSSSINFIIANDQLSKLSIEFPSSSELLGSKLLPALSQSFVNLTSLRLTWSEESIPREALEIISTIKGLEQICLSAGEQIGWYHDWLIDHQVMRKTFMHLPRLRKFAFSRDSYNDRATQTPVERYYLETYTREVMQAPEIINYFRQDRTDGDRNPREFPKLCKRVWERLHQEKMLSEAQNYLQELPNHPLEWMYFGQIPMGVKSDSGHKLAYPLFHERDDCFTLLRKMFNWDTYDFTEDK